MTTLLSANSRDNRNISSSIALFFKNLKIIPRSCPGWAVDFAMILQEIHFVLSYEKTGLIVNGRKMIHYTAEKLAEKLTHLHPNTIAKRLRFLTKHGFLITEKPSLNYCAFVNYYCLGDRAFECLEAVNPMVVNFYDHKNKLLQSVKTDLNKQQLNKQEKENIERAWNKLDAIELVPRPQAEKTFTDKKNISALRSDGEARDKSIMSAEQGNQTSSAADKSNKNTTVPQVDEKVNTIEKPITKQERKEMANHYPEGDRYSLNGKNYNQTRKETGKMSSALGMSDFKNLEDLRQCQRELTRFFAKTLDTKSADREARFIIKAEKQGERSSLVQDYLDGNAIGSWNQKEWEVEPGRIKPVFLSYLRFKLRQKEQTRELSNRSVDFYLKNLESVSDAWDECKRIYELWEPRLIKAHNLGQNLYALDIPEWVIDCFRPVVPLEKVVKTADTLAAIAESFGEQRQQIQQRLEPTKLNQLLPENSPLNRLKPEPEPESEPEKDMSLTKSQQDRIDALPAEIFEKMPTADPSDIKPEISKIQEIDLMLKDEIMRPRGCVMAKKRGFPLLLSNDGIAIGIDFAALKDNADPLNPDGSFSPSPCRGDRSFHDEGHGDAHKIYQPEEIEKGSLSAWQAAIAKSKFLRNRRKTVE